MREYHSIPRHGRAELCGKCGEPNLTDEYKAVTKALAARFNIREQGSLGKGVVIQTCKKCGTSRLRKTMLGR